MEIITKINMYKNKIFSNNNTLHNRIKIFVFIYFIILGIYISTFTPRLWGEWDDYALPAVSIIYQGNFGIDDEDIKNAKKLFPGHDESIDHYGLSPYKNTSGDEMAWYFPTYSIASIPMILIFLLLKIPAIYAFAFTNLLSLFLVICLIYKKLSEDKRTRNIVILAICLNPIVFYLPWLSAEVLIYSLVTASVFLWIRGEKKKSAFLISLAGTLNPAILCFGIIMILEYIARLFYKLYYIKKNKLLMFKKYIFKLFLYGSCYIIALVPFLYNFYETGHINLTSSLSRFTVSETSTLSRFLAYLFDLNFGFLPYFPILFLVSCIGLIIAIIKRHISYICCMVSFFMTIAVYSMMVHINCGMSGISRYNSWTSPLIVIPVIIYGFEMIRDVKIKKIFSKLIISSILLTGSIVYWFGPMWADDYNMTENYMTPIARLVLDNVPTLYNPLPSTFNSRSNRIDGGYEIVNPVIYATSDGNVTKILASPKDKEYLQNIVKDKKIPRKSYEIYIEKIKGIKSENSYINLPASLEIPKFETNIKTLDLNQDYLFYSKTRTAEAYVLQGLSGNEGTFSWTDGNILELKFMLLGTQNTAQALINIGAVYGMYQNVNIEVNDKLLQKTKITGPQQLKIDFEIPENRVIDIKLMLPDAGVSNTINTSSDLRKLGLAIVDMTIN